MSEIRRACSAGPRCGALAALLLGAVLLGTGPLAAQARLELRSGDRIVFLGNAFAERMQLFGHFETRLLLAFPELDLTFRNLAWSADEITLRPRPLNFGDLKTHLARQQADVVFLFYGANEAWAGEDALAAFRRQLQSFLQGLSQRSFNGETPPRLVLVSPISQEQVGILPDPSERNRVLARYTEAMEAVALELELPFVDLFGPMATAMAEDPEPLTLNGVHLDQRGDALAARLLMAELGFAEERPDPESAASATPSNLAEAVRQTVVRRNRLFFDRYRAVNGYYIYGDRKEPFGVKSFPSEMARFDQLVAELDLELHRLAKGGRR